MEHPNSHAFGSTRTGWDNLMVFESLQQLVNQMMSIFQSSQLQALGPQIYLIFFVLVLFEGSAITFLAGMAAASGLLNPVPIYVLAVLGNTTTDWFWYGLGYLGKVEWLAGNGPARKVWRRLGGDLTLGQIERIQDRMREHAPRVLLIAKLTAGFAIASLIATGLVKVSPRRWVPPVLFSEAIRSGVLVFLGYHMTRSLAQIEAGLGWLLLVGFLIMLGYISWYVRHAAMKWLNG